MITIFNRKELIVTNDMKRQSQIRDILSADGIDYTISTKNIMGSQTGGSRRSTFGNTGLNQNYSYEYKIYVHKKDYDKALFLIRRA